jgi:hypothetical protein
MLSCAPESEVMVTRAEAEAEALRHSMGAEKVLGSGVGCWVQARPLSAAPVWVVKLDPPEDSPSSAMFAFGSVTERTLVVIDGQSGKFGMSHSWSSLLSENEGPP